MCKHQPARKAATHRGARPPAPPPPQVARCTKIINPNTDEAKYVINIKQIAKFVVGLGDKVRRCELQGSDWWS